MRYHAVLLLAVALLLITGCSKQQTQTTAPTEDKKWRVGVTLLTKQHPFYQELEAAMRETAQKEGIELLVQSAEFNLADQTAQVENFLTSGVDALIICPVDSAGIAGAVKKANAAKVPVFTADIAAQGGEVVCHVASDNVQGGRLAGEYMAKLLNGKGKIVIIDHPVVTSVQDRTRGFLEAISKYPGIQVVDRPPGDGVRDKAMAVTETMLQKYPDLAGIFAINDSTALGALKAVESMGRTNVVIVGYDGDPEARREILRGSPLKADAVQFPRRIGSTVVEMVAKHLRGEQVPKLVPIPCDMIDKQKLEKEARETP
ncbi:MAG: periplasmic sugar-binding protein of ABC transporter [Armatimonadota bacterium]|nr:MAG: periplasmic sugar-binding protein of ABC transporter [Armatimonadota bacterium]